MRRRVVIFAVLFLTGAATLLAAQLASLLPSFFGSSTEDTALNTEPGSKPAAPGSPEKAAGKSAQKPGPDAGLDAALAPAPDPSTLAEPQLDIPRISPSGSSVFAGRARPHSYVTVYENETPVGSVKADENGEWSLVTEHRFASLEPNLAFKGGAAPMPTPDTAQAAMAPQVAASADGGKAPGSEASPEAVAKNLMSGFEKLVAEAREESKAEASKAEASKAEAAKPQPAPEPVPTVDVPAAAPPPAQAAAAPPAEVTVSDAPKAATKKEEASEKAPATTPAEPRIAAAEPGAAQKPVPVQGSASIPVPILFVYNEAHFTNEGRRAAELLLEYLKLKHLKSISLSGHADERGSDDYNLDLSRERLDAVAAYLRDGGFSGELDLVPKGKSEPFTGIDRNKFSGEALYQFDRRVELHVYR